MKSVPMLSGAFLQPAGQSLPEPLLAVRNERAAALADMPMPTRRTENWKYSSKHLKLTEDMAATLPATDKTSNLDVPGYRIVLNNGAINRADSQYPDQGGISVQHFSDLDADDASALAQKLGSTLDAEQTQFAQINSARFENGLLIRLAANAVLDKPLFIIHETAATRNGSAFPRIFVEAGTNSQMTLVEAYVSEGDSAALVDTVTEFQLADGANITSIRLTMEGESAETKLNGVVVTQGKQHYDNHTSIDHVAAHCNSEETYRNIAAGQSHAVFNGRIHIHQDAQKSNADMNNKNLLLSNGAEIDTKPELEIYADDVKCAHGATIGQLDETSVFYLISRGIGRRQANVLLTMAFINELVEQIPVEAVRDTAQARLNDFFDQTFQEA